jgi:hypothetical protein
MTSSSSTIYKIYEYIKNNYEKQSIEQIFEDLLLKNNYFFDIQLGYFSLLNELNKSGIQIEDKKTDVKKIRADYEYKQNVKKLYNETCIISGADIDECSICHIKPLSESSYNEKYDYNNGIILSESLHRLFDKYYFTINPETFEIIISQNIKHKKLLINNFIGKKLDIYKSSKKYLEYHYNKFNEKSNL